MGLRVEGPVVPDFLLAVEVERYATEGHGEISTALRSPNPGDFPFPDLMRIGYAKVHVFPQ